MSLYPANRCVIIAVLFLLFFSPCVIPPPVTAQNLPDLRPEISQVTIRKDQTVEQGDVIEGCARATTGRTLIAFTHTAWNDGPGDIDVGDPLCPSCEESYVPVCGNPLFECSPAGGHNHAHLRDFSSYTVSKRGQSEAILRGHKEGFCLMSSTCVDGVTPPQVSNCSFMAAGCGDIYPTGLGCQYVDITGLKPGKYTLSVELNPLRNIVEASYANNVLTYDFEICKRTPGKLKFTYGLGRDEWQGKRPVTIEAVFYFPSAKMIKFFNPMYQGLQFSMTVSPRSTEFVTLPAGKVGRGCYPKDGWKRTGNNVWEYRNDSDLDPNCFTGAMQGFRSARVKKEGNKVELTLNGRKEPTSLPPIPLNTSMQLNLSALPSYPENDTCAYKVTTTSCSRVGPGKALIQCQ